MNPRVRSILLWGILGGGILFIGFVSWVLVRPLLWSPDVEVKVSRIHWGGSGGLIRGVTADCTITNRGGPVVVFSDEEGRPTGLLDLVPPARPIPVQGRWFGQHAVVIAAGEAGETKVKEIYLENLAERKVRVCVIVHPVPDGLTQLINKFLKQQQLPESVRQKLGGHFFPHCAVFSEWYHETES